MCIVGGCAESVTRRIDPSQMPSSTSILVYRRYGPKYTPLVGATLYKSTPLEGGGPVKPDKAGDCKLSKPGVRGMPGDAKGLPKADKAGEASGWLLYMLPTGDKGVSLRFNGVGPLGNSHWVD